MTKDDKKSTSELHGKKISARGRNALRALISTLLMISGGVSFITGGTLYFFKRGMLWIFSRGFLNDLHAIASLVMLAALIVHLTLNVRMYKNELKALRRALAEKEKK